MKIVELSLRRRVTVSMCAVALVLFGAVAFTRLPINLLPDLSYPSLTVETRFPGAAPAEVESLISRPVEEAVGIVSGVQRITSVSRPGLSQVTLELDWGQSMDFAALDVRQKLDLVPLPREAEKPVILRFDPANDPVMRLYLTAKSPEADLYRLRYVAEELLKKDLESTEGVAAIKVNGGFEEEIQVRIDEGKLALLGLSIEDVNQRLLRENVNQAGGSLYESEARYLVRSSNELRTVEEILGVILVSRDGRNVTLRDVATVERGHRQREVISRFGGREAVELALYKEGDANTVAVAQAVRERLENLGKELPADVEVTTGEDQSRFIRASIDEVLGNAILGGLIAVVVLLFFLKDLRSTLIIGASIPVSIIATFFLMYRTGTTLNVMSLGGLALGVGMLVDNAIVVLEAIFRRRELGEGATESARRGASEVGMAVVASTLTTVAVFLPVIFLEGIAAQLFRDQALTVSFSLLASLAVSLTLIPLFASRERGEWRFRRAAAAAGRFVGRLTAPVVRPFDASLDALMRSYPPALRWALRSRAVVLGVTLLAFAWSVWMFPRLGFDLVPSFSQGEFGFAVELPEGTPLERTDAFVREVQAALEGDSRVASVSTISGGAALSLTSTGTEGESSARIQVRMAPDASLEDESEVAALLRERLEASGLARFEMERPTYFTFRTPIEVEVYGDDLTAVHGAAAAVHERLAKIPGLVDLQTSAEMGNPEIQVRFQRDQLVRLGLDLSLVAETVRSKVQGAVATRFLQGDREIDIRVRSVEVGKASVANLRDLIVAQRNGVAIPLSAVADVQVAEGPTEIRRIGQKRAAVISGNLEGRDMAAVAADVRAALGELQLPADVAASLSGQEEEMTRSLRSLLLAMGLAIFLVYLVMASQFESLLHPFVILFTLPLGAIGAVGALALTGRSVDIVAMIGMVMLAGIVVNNAIVLIDAVNQLRREGRSRAEALVQAGLTRMRPILMTTSTTVLGLIPMALGLGEGAELRAPLAITVIGGLSVATVLTLIVVPVVYTLFDRTKEPQAVEDPVADAHPLGAEVVS